MTHHEAFERALVATPKRCHHRSIIARRPNRSAIGEREEWFRPGRGHMGRRQHAGGGAHPTSRSVPEPAPFPNRSQHGASAWGDDIPATPELFDILTEHLAGLPISDVAVQRMAAIGDLSRTVAPPRAAEQARSRSG